MDVRQIEAFVEIARHGSVTRAAQTLYLTQPTVTNRLQSLEAEVGEPLFSRVQYGVVLTEAGKTLLPFAERALQALNEGTSALKELHDGTRGTLYVSSVRLISNYVLPQLLERFSESRPGVQVVIRSDHTEEVVARVLSSDVQIGLCYKVRHSDIAAVKLYDDELLLVVYPDHPFSRRLEVGVQEVVGESLALLVAADYVQRVGEVFGSAGLGVPASKFQIDSVDVVKLLVQKGLAISLLPGIALRQEIRQGLLKVVPMAGVPPIKREMVAIYRKNSGLGGIARAFLDTVREHYASSECEPA
ncbi:MAG: LysR family transcriptional regulator [Anaerolineae bacterium]|nr:LysR family transcriptional regulator [Anaerolineae bacterium]